MLKIFVKHLLKKESKCSITNDTRSIMLKAIDDKDSYKKNKSFIVQLTNYYREKGMFTPLQNKAVRRVLNG